MIKEILGKFGYSKKEQPKQLRDDLTVYRSLRSILEENGTAVTQPYSQSVWIYACVQAISGNIQRVPFRLYKERPSGREPKIIEKGPAYDVFTNPNPYMTQELLFSATMIFLSLYGECFWILERENITQIPTEIWTFNPTRFKPIIDERTTNILGWVYMEGTKHEETFPASQIIHIKYFNPYDDIRGMSPITAGQISIDQDFYASQYNINFFKEGCEVGGFLTTDEEMDDDNWNRTLKQFENRHKGAGKAHRIALVSGQGAKFTEAKITQRDMEFIEGKKMTRQEIFAIYKVNEVVLGLYQDIKSYEGIKAAHKAFWEECLVPKITYMENLLWAKMFSKIEGGKLYGAFDLANVGPLQVNYSEKIDTAMKMFHMGWPINQINQRLQMGMQDVPWGDEWWVPGGFLPVTQILAGESTNNDKPKKPKEDEEVEVVEDSIRYFPLEKEYKKKLTRFLFDCRKLSLDAIYNNKEVKVGDKEYDRLTKGLTDVYTQAINHGVFCVQRDFGEVIPVTEVYTKSTEFRYSRVNYVVNGFRSVISGIPCEDADRIRDIYNMLSNKVNELAKSESDAAVKYGTELAAKYVKKALVLTEKEDEEDGQES